MDTDHRSEDLAGQVVRLLFDPRHGKVHEGINGLYTGSGRSQALLSTVASSQSLIATWARACITDATSCILKSLNSAAMRGKRCTATACVIEWLGKAFAKAQTMLASYCGPKFIMRIASGEAIKNASCAKPLMAKP